MKLLCLSPAEFIHFGITRELLNLLTEEISDYEYLDWKPLVFTNRTENEKSLPIAAHNALISEETVVEEGCYVENSWLKGNTILK